jgi:hypothetical protein
MKVKEENITTTHRNVMELLVQEEIERQIKRYPVALALHTNRVEVATYALNRLPPLYASSEKGKNQQKLLGYKEFKKQITMAVRQGLAAVHRDPIRVSTPLISEVEAKYQSADAALVELQDLLEKRNLLDYQKLTWDNLVNVVQRALNKTAWIGMSQPPQDNE